MDKTQHAKTETQCKQREGNPKNQEEMLKIKTKK